MFAVVAWREIHVTRPNVNRWLRAGMAIGLGAGALAILAPSWRCDDAETSLVVGRWIFGSWEPSLWAMRVAMALAAASVCVLAVGVVQALRKGERTFSWAAWFLFLVAVGQDAGVKAVYLAGCALGIFKL
jgi:hypothetical protein